MFVNKTKNSGPDKALAGRAEPMVLSSSTHYVNGNQIKPPWPQGFEQAMFGLGCFWGAERLFWRLDGVWVTAVGYSAGTTPNATYREVCTGKTGHNEVVLVVFDPKVIAYQTLLQTFWQGHNPTQYMRQGNDVGTQYRSGIYTYNEAQATAAKQSQTIYQQALSVDGFDQIKTEILSATDFYYAEEAHQQYLAKNPSGYCGLGGTGVSCPVEHE